jgi:hypothetical protein
MRARSLGIMIQIKKKEDICWYLQFYYFLASFRKIQDCVIEEEDFENLKDSFSFRLYFVIAGIACISLPCTVCCYKYIMALFQNKVVQLSICNFYYF